MSFRRVAFPTTRRSAIMLKLFRHTYHGIHSGRNAESCYMQWRAGEKLTGRYTCPHGFAPAFPQDFFRTRRCYYSELNKWQQRMYEEETNGKTTALS